MKGQITRTNLCGLGIILTSLFCLQSAAQERNVIYQEHLRRQPEITEKTIEESDRYATKAYSNKLGVYVPIAAAFVGLGLIYKKSKEDK